MGVDEGWRPDPREPGQLRYWDGARWTEQTMPAGPWPPGAGPAPAPAFLPSADRTGPEDVASVNRQALLILLAGLVAVVLIVAVAVLVARRPAEELTSPTPTTSVSPSRGRAAPSTTTDPRSVAGRPCVAASSGVPQAAGKPHVDISVGPPPPGLVIEDLTVGRGPAVRPTDRVTVHYVGLACSTGKQFDASWDRGEPVTFSLDGVIQGWTQGVPGMQVGGRRQLVIPPDLAYGDEQKSPDIAPGETLIFVIDLLAIDGGDDPPTRGGTFPSHSATDCPPVDGSAARRTTFAMPPPSCIDPARAYTATIATDKGDIVIDLDPGAAPLTVNNFVVLARYHYYDGVPFHRVIRGFMAQGGDATGEPKGSGGPGYEIPDELPSQPYRPGDLAMANRGPDTNGSQFFIYVGPSPLDLHYTRFGHVRDGLDSTVAAILDGGADADGQPMANPTTIKTVTIAER